MNRRDLLKGIVGGAALAALPLGASTASPFPANAQPWDIYRLDGFVWWLHPTNGWMNIGSIPRDETRGSVKIGSGQPESNPVPTKLFEIEHERMSEGELHDFAQRIAKLDGSTISHLDIEPNPFVIDGVGYPNVVGVYGWRTN